MGLCRDLRNALDRHRYFSGLLRTGMDAHHAGLGVRFSFMIFLAVSGTLFALRSFFVFNMINDIVEILAIITNEDFLTFLLNYTPHD